MDGVWSTASHSQQASRTGFGMRGEDEEGCEQGSHLYEQWGDEVGVYTVEQAEEESRVAMQAGRWGKARGELRLDGATGPGSLSTVVDRRRSTTVGEESTGMRDAVPSVRDISPTGQPRPGVATGDLRELHAEPDHDVSELGERGGRGQGTGTQAQAQAGLGPTAHQPVTDTATAVEEHRGASIGTESSGQPLPWVDTGDLRELHAETYHDVSELGERWGRGHGTGNQAGRNTHRGGEDGLAGISTQPAETEPGASHGAPWRARVQKGKGPGGKGGSGTGGRPGGREVALQRLPPALSMVTEESAQESAQAAAPSPKCAGCEPVEATYTATRGDEVIELDTEHMSPAARQEVSIGSDEPTTARISEAIGKLPTTALPSGPIDALAAPSGALAALGLLPGATDSARGGGSPPVALGTAADPIDVAQPSAAPSTRGAQRPRVTGGSRVPQQSFASDVRRKDLRVYHDRTAKMGLQRGACVVGDVGSRTVPRLQALCGGVVLSDEGTRHAVQRAYAVSIRGTGHTLYGHPYWNWWTLINEDTGSPANHRFQVWDLSIQADWVLGLGQLAEWAPTRRQAARNASADRQTEPIHVSVVGVVQVAALGDDGRCTIYYGPAYTRAYGAANESLLQTEVAQRDLWDLLDEQGLRGREALEAVLDRAAPTDPQDVELGAQLLAWRTRRGFVGRLTHAQAKLVVGVPTPAAVVQQGGAAAPGRVEGPQQTPADCLSRGAPAVTERPPTAPATGTADVSRDRASTQGGPPDVDDTAHVASGSPTRRTSLGYTTEAVAAVAARMGLTVWPLTAGQAPQLSQAAQACCVCGRSEGGLVCHDESIYLCAEAREGRGCSCLWLYLAVCSEGSRFVSHETEDGSIVRLRCVVSGKAAPLWRGASSSATTTQLGLAPATDSSVGLLLASSVSAATRNSRLLTSPIPAVWSKWQPAVTRQHALSLITVRAQEPSRERRLEPRSRLIYDSVLQYRAVWQQMVQAAGSHERRQCEQQQRVAVPVRWQRDLNGGWCVAVFSVPPGTGRVGERYSLVREGAADGAPAWQGVQTVRGVTRAGGGKDEVRAVGATVPKADRAGCSYTIVPQFNATNYERSQTALRIMAADTALTSRGLISRLVGVAVAASSLRVRMPPADLTPPGMPTLDPYQSAAVRGCLQSVLALIQGPPGTGKTATVAAHVFHLVRQGAGSVLVCAPSNAAATRIAEYLRGLGLQVLRHFSKAREVEAAAVHAELRLAHHAAGVDSDNARTVGKLIELKAEFGAAADSDERLLGELQEAVNDEAMRRADVVVCTTMTAGSTEIARHVFKLVVIDEAAQATEADTVVPLILGAERLVLVGDHRQLGPVVKHMPSLRAGMGVSLFERLAGGSIPQFLLATQYRMHPELSVYAGQAFYDGRLRDGVTAEQRASHVQWPVASYPGYFHDVPANDRFVGTSRANDAEATVVVATVGWLLGQRVPASDIGIIATYGAQVSVIRRALDRARSGSVVVNTVDSYQGQERAFIIISFVRGAGGGSLSFLEMAPRLNVAMTRCQRGRICIGNAATMRRGTLLRDLVRHHEARGAVLRGTVGSLTSIASERTVALATVPRELATVPRCLPGVAAFSEAAVVAAAARGQEALLVQDREARGEWTFTVVEALLKSLVPAWGAGLTPKVTGMLLELEATELARLTLRQIRGYVEEALNILHVPITCDVGHEQRPLGLEPTDALGQWADLADGTAEDREGSNAASWVTCMDYNAADEGGHGYRLPVDELPLVGCVMSPAAALVEEAMATDVGQAGGTYLLEGEWAGSALNPRVMRAQHRRGCFSRLLLLWRARIVGYMSSSEMVLYWRYVRAGHRTALQRLVWRARYSNGREPSRALALSGLVISKRIGVPVLRSMRAALQRAADRSLTQSNGVYFRVVRQCACWYGMRRVLGRATTEDDRCRAQAHARRAIQWYAAAYAPLVALIPHALFAALFAHPGGHLEALRLLGASVFGVDNAEDMRAAQRWFHVIADAAPRTVNLIRRGGCATLHAGDALRPGDVADAARSHAQQHMGGRMAVVAHFDTPPCTPYGPLAKMHLPRSRRMVHHQACLSTVVAQRVHDYSLSGEVFLIETVSHGGHYVSGGASVVFVSGHQVGLETRDDHAFITPLDRPFIVDESLRRQGVQIRAGSCAGARPVSALHPCGTPVQNPWSRPCCEGDGLSLYGSGVRAATLSRICAVVGLSEKHLVSKDHAADVLPLMLAMWGGAQLINQALSRCTGFPIISFDSAEADDLIREWRDGVFDEVSKAAKMPAGFPLRQAIVVVFPPAGQGLTVITTGGRLVRVQLPVDGVDLVSTVAARLEQSFPGLGVLPRNLRFVTCLNGTIAFYSAFVSDAARGVGGEGRKTGGGRDRPGQEPLENGQEPLEDTDCADLLTRLKEEQSEEAVILEAAQRLLLRASQPTGPVADVTVIAQQQGPLKGGPVTQCPRCGAKRRLDHCGRCEQHRMCSVCDSCADCAKADYESELKPEEAATAGSWAGLTVAGALGVRSCTDGQDDEGEVLGNEVLLTEDTGETVSKWQAQYTARRRELLKNSPHARVTFAARQPKEGGEDGDDKVVTQRVAQLLLMWGDKVVTPAVDHSGVSVFEALVPRVSGRELRAQERVGPDGVTMSDSWSVRRVLCGAIEPMFGGSAVECRLHQLIGEACAQGPAHTHTMTHAAADYTGVGRGPAASGRRLECELYVVSLEGTVDWQSRAGDAVGTWWRQSQRDQAKGYEAQLLRTTVTAGGTRLVAIHGDPAAVATAPFAAPQDSRSALVANSLVVSTVPEFTGHLAQTGRGRLAAAITAALGTTVTTQPATPLAQATWVLQCDPESGLLARPGPLSEWMREQQSLLDYPLWPGEQRATPVSVPLSADAFESALRVGQFEYVVPLAVWPGQREELDRGQRIQLFNIESGLSATVEIVQGLRVLSRGTLLQLSRLRHMLLPGVVTPAHDRHGVIAVRVESMSGIRVLHPPTRATLSVAGTIRGIRTLQRAVRHWRAARREWATGLLGASVRRHRGAWQARRARRDAALSIQTGWRQYAARDYVAELRASQDAGRLQAAWRSAGVAQAYRQQLGVRPSQLEDGGEQRACEQRTAGVVALQAAARGAAEVRRYQRCLRAVGVLQRFARGASADPVTAGLSLTTPIGAVVTSHVSTAVRAVKASKVWFYRLEPQTGERQLYASYRRDSSIEHPQFDTFGGAMDPGDDGRPDLCARRELTEEVNLPALWAAAAEHAFVASPNGHTAIQLHQSSRGLDHHLTLWMVEAPACAVGDRPTLTRNGSRELASAHLQWWPAAKVVADLSKFPTFLKLSQSISGLLSAVSTAGRVVASGTLPAPTVAEAQLSAETPRQQQPGGGPWPTAPLVGRLLSRAKGQHWSGRQHS